MDYNKQRWLERQQHQEQPRDEYERIHRTYFSNDYGYIYIADVKVYSRFTIINLYIETIAEDFNPPLWAKIMFKFLGGDASDRRPICSPRRISHNDNLPGMIKRMIADYEMPLYQRWMAEQMDEELQIDYAAELGKRRQRLINIDQEPAQQTQQTTAYESAKVHIWDEEPEITEEQKKEQRIQELAARDGVSPEKYRNLLPFRNKKSS